MTKKIAVINIGLYGHINPTLAFTQELVSKGHSVFYYATPEFKAFVETTGAIFRSYDSQLKKLLDVSTSITNLIPFLAIEGCQKDLPLLLALVKADAPDIIVYDMYSLSGQLIAEILSIPAIKFYPTYASNEHFNLHYSTLAYQRISPDEALIASFDTGIRELSRNFSFKSFGFDEWIIHAARLNIVSIPHSFQPMSETFDSRFEFVGPCFKQPNVNLDWVFKRQSCPLIYISLGTLFNQWIEFFQMCIAAFGEKPYNVVMACGHHIQVEELGSVPSNFIMQQHVPQLSVLEQADLFVSHGGMNSTIEALFFGTPLVVIPQDVDQEVTACRLNQMGLGFHLPKQQVNVSSLIQAVEQVFLDGQMQKRVIAMQSILKASGGYKRVVELIDNFGAL